MTTYGLTDDGLVIKTAEVIREEINEDMREAFGQDFKLSDSSAAGKLVGIIAERYGILWELAETINSDQDPDAATGTGLDAVCALTGTLRNPATRSTVTETLTGTVGTVVGSGSLVQVDGTLTD